MVEPAPVGSTMVPVARVIWFMARRTSVALKVTLSPRISAETRSWAMSSSSDPVGPGAAII